MVINMSFRFSLHCVTSYLLLFKDVHFTQLNQIKTGIELGQILKNALITLSLNVAMPRRKK